MHRKVVASIVVCLLAVMMAVGGIMPPTAAALVPPPTAVSIDPDTRTVSPGDTFSINVLVDSGNYNLLACHVEVGYNAAVFAASAPVYQGLLGAAADVLVEPGSGVVDGLVKYGVTRVAGVGNPAVPVNGALITIDFTVDPDAEPDTYPLEVQNVILKDENNEDLPVDYVFDGEVVIEGGEKGDFTGDDGINFDDFVSFGLAYNSVTGDPNYNPIGDFNGDGEINFDDFVSFGLIYNTCPYA